jgi:hypothetical protein
MQTQKKTAFLSLHSFVLILITDHPTSAADGLHALPAGVHSLILISVRTSVPSRGDLVFAQHQSLHFVRTTVKRTTETTSEMRL